MPFKNKSNSYKVNEEFTLPPYIVENVVSSLSQVQGWGIKQLRVPETWSITKGAGIRCLVIDSGCSDHFELENRINKDLCRSFIDNDIMDYQGHSTHCLGIIGAEDDSSGMVGVAPECELITCKTLNKEGIGGLGAIIKALEYAVELKPDVISMSLGAILYNRALHEAVKALYDMNIPIVCASGNNPRVPVMFPAGLPETIAVTAFDRYGKPARFNSIGEAVDISAPGVDIYSTYLNQSYAKLSGTCLSGGTLVYTKNGPRYISDIQKGDLVYALNEQTNKIELCNVQKVLCNGIQQTYKIKTQREELIATDNHPILTINKKVISVGNIRKKYEYSIQWKQVKQLQKGDIVLTAKDLPESREQLDKINNKLMSTNKDLQLKLKNVPSTSIQLTTSLCQFIGAFLGDGYIYHDNRALNKRAGIGLCIRNGYKQLDKQLPEKYNNCFISAFGEPVTRITNGDLFKYSQYLANVLGELDLDYSVYEKRIPSWCFSLPRQYKIAIISGLIDSDGYITKNGDFYIELCNKELINDIKMLLYSVGVKSANVLKRNNKPNNYCEYPKQSYCLTSTQIVNIRDELTVLDKSYNTFLNNRKLSHKKRNIETVSNILKEIYENYQEESIQKITKEICEPVYDLTIENNHNFIANGIIVHNSMACPFIAGIVCLLLSKHRLQEEATGKNDCKTVDQIKEHLIKYATDKGEVGKDSKWGYGMIDPYKLLLEELEELEEA